MELEIRYENGIMIINLEEFLNSRSISRVKRLLKLIRNSFTPECERQMKEFILLRLRQSDFDRNIRNKEFYGKVLENIT